MMSIVSFLLKTLKSFTSATSCWPFTIKVSPIQVGAIQEKSATSALNLGALKNLILGKQSKICSLFFNTIR